MSDPNTQDDGIASNHEPAHEPPQPDGRLREPDTRPEPAPTPRPPAEPGATRVDYSSMEQRGLGDPFSHGFFPPASLTVATQQLRSGPLPPAAELAEYKQVQNDLPERIISMAEVTVQGREDRANKLVDAEVEAGKTGQAFAFLIAAFCVVAAVVFFALGNNVAGGFLVGIPVVLLVQSFLKNGGTSDDGAS